MERKIYLYIWGYTSFVSPTYPPDCVSLHFAKALSKLYARYINLLSSILFSDYFSLPQILITSSTMCHAIACSLPTERVCTVHTAHCMKRQPAGRKPLESLQMNCHVDIMTGFLHTSENPRNRCVFNHNVGELKTVCQLYWHWGDEQLATHRCNTKWRTAYLSLDACLCISAVQFLCSEVSMWRCCCRWCCCCCWSVNRNHCSALQNATNG